MILACFLFFSRSAYVELSGETSSLIGGEVPIFVKFYSEQCGHCLAMAEDFDEAAAAFSNVTFGGVECNVNQDLCKVHNISGYPTILLFLPGNKTGIAFNGVRSLDGFCDFVENHTSFKAQRPAKVTVDLHPLNFENYVNSTKCLFVTFYVPWCGHCKRFLPQTRLAANAFLGDAPNETFGQVNCDQFREFCKDYADGYPTIALFVNGVNKSYQGDRTLAGVASFVNAECGTERGTNGLLVDTAGLVPEASAIAQQFIAAADKSGFLEKMKSIPGADFYVKVVERFLAKGEEQIKKDIATMEGILVARKGSSASLDGIKRRYNVFVQFVPKPEPTPSPTTDESQTNL
jgi:thioredoxin-like negative regulator of GroEL